MLRLSILAVACHLAVISFSQQVTDIKVTADQVAYSGSCPVRITFKATIYSKGKGSLKYVWLRNDNATDNNNSYVTLNGTGVDVVTTTWTLGSPGMSYSGWEALQVISPVNFTSEKAGFSIKCNGGKGNGNPGNGKPVVISNIPGCDSLPVGYNAASLPNLLTNGDFERVGSYGNPTTSSGSVFGWSAADKWSTWIDHRISGGPTDAEEGTVYTEMIASTASAGGSKMIHVKTSGHGDGIVQVFGDYGAGPQKVMVSMWIYVIAGRVGIGVGNGGNTATTSMTNTTGKWEFVQTCNSVSPANEIIIYGQNSEFYIDNVKVTFIR
jgi:hypothetical protein